MGSNLITDYWYDSFLSLIALPNCTRWNDLLQQIPIVNFYLTCGRIHEMKKKESF